MNNLAIYYIYLGTLVLPALVALVKYGRALPEFRPMLAFSWLLLAIEISRTFFEEGSAAVIFTENFHYLFEMLGVCYIGWRWRIFSGRPGFLRILLVFVIVCWAAEKLVFGWATGVSWCRILFSFMIALLAFDFLHRAFFHESVGRQKNAILLFCIALGVYYLVGGLMEASIALVSTPSFAFIQDLFYYSLVLGVLFNLTVLISYICISPKRGFSLV